MRCVRLATAHASSRPGHRPSLALEDTREGFSAVVRDGVVVVSHSFIEIMSGIPDDHAPRLSVRAAVSVKNPNRPYFVIDGFGVNHHRKAFNSFEFLKSQDFLHFLHSLKSEASAALDQPPLA